MYLELVNVTADIGYTPGDRVVVYPWLAATGDNRGYALRWDSANIKLRVASSGIAIVREDTGAWGDIVEANWNLVVHAKRRI